MSQELLLLIWGPESGIYANSGSSKRADDGASFGTMMAL